MSTHATQAIEFTAPDGARVGGALALPAGDGPAPTVVVLHEWWGLTDHIRGIAARWAAAGFVALAPDLYRGTVARDATEASALMTGLDRPRALGDIAAAVAYVRAQGRATGRTVVTGYCMGGALALGAACRVRGLGAAIPFYGVPRAEDWTQLEAPVQLHVADRDDWVTPALAEATAAAIRAAGGTIETPTYAAAHAFCNDTRPEVFDAAAATEAWQRAVAFARAHAAGA